MGIFVQFLIYDIGCHKTFVHSRNCCVFATKIQLFCEMSNQLYKSIARYFYRLGLAIVGKDYIYSNVYVALNERVEKAESDLKQLKEMYNAVLGKWSTDASLVKRLAEESTRLHTEVNSYKQLVETLRGSIRDKQSLIDAYVKTERKKRTTNEYWSSYKDASTEAKHDTRRAGDTCWYERECHQLVGARQE